MLVVKFGGTSVGKPERMKKIADLVVAMPGKRHQHEPRFAEKNNGVGRPT